MMLEAPYRVQSGTSRNIQLQLKQDSSTLTMVVLISCHSTSEMYGNRVHHICIYSLALNIKVKESKKKDITIHGGNDGCASYSSRSRLCNFHFIFASKRSCNSESIERKRKVAFALLLSLIELQIRMPHISCLALPCHAMLSPPCTRPQLKTSKSRLECFSLVTNKKKRHLSRLGSLEGLLAPGLGLGLSLLLLGGELESGGALDGLGAEVGAVTLLVGGVDDGAVDLAAGGGALELGLLESLGGLVGVAAELGGEDNLAVLASRETDGRGVGE